MCSGSPEQMLSQLYPISDGSGEWTKRLLACAIAVSSPASQMRVSSRHVHHLD